MQLLLRQKPEWRGERVVWLQELKADARVRYLSAEAARAGAYQGARYATILGVVPDLLAGTGGAEELAKADEQLVEHLRQFSPQIRRRSQHLEQGLYLLDASGLGRAFKGYKRWAKELVGSLRKLGWETRLAVGFTPFATEMATEIIDQAMQSFGAMGMTRELPFAIMSQRLRLARIYEGPTEVHRMVIARRVLKGRV